MLIGGFWRALDEVGLEGGMEWWGGGLVFFGWSLLPEEGVESDCEGGDWGFVSGRGDLFFFWRFYWRLAVERFLVEVYGPSGFAEEVGHFDAEFFFFLMGKGFKAG